MSMRYIRQTFLCNFFSFAFGRAHSRKEEPPRSLVPSTSTQKGPSDVNLSLLLNLGQNLRILEQEIFLQINHAKKKNQKIKKARQSPPLIKVKKKRSARARARTSSPNLMAFPPQPGNNTRSPALTDVGMTRPPLS